MMLGIAHLLFAWAVVAVALAGLATLSGRAAGRSPAGQPVAPSVRR
jgi:hypothetical protein